MGRPQKLDETEVQRRLAELPGWRLEQGEMVREFKFDDFRQAYGFMTRLALFAEKLDHHPNWSNVYNRVRIAMSTHDAGGITELDFQFAEEANAQAG